MPSLVSNWVSLLHNSPEEGHFTGIRWFSRFTSTYVLTRCLSSIIYTALFRLKRYSDAISLLKSLLDQRTYQSTKRGYWYDELARLTENHLSPKGKEEAMLICKQGLSDTMVVSHRRSSLYKRLASISKSLGRHPIQLKDRPSISSSKYPSLFLYGKQVMNQATSSHVLFYSHHQKEGQEMPLVRVEKYVLEHFEMEGWKGYHAENSIITTLFGLLFWDILFDSSVPGAFAHSFQTAPLDLYTEFFFESRRDAILTRLDDIKNGKAGDLINQVCKNERERQTLCIGVNWRFSTTDVIEITECIGPVALSRICELFSRQYWSHRGGVPDLCLWNACKKRFRLVEVKSENDRLSEKQVCWLQFLASVDVDIQVVHVRNVVSKNNDQKSKTNFGKRRRVI